MLARGGEYRCTEDRNIYTSVPSLPLPSTGANYTVRKRKGVPGLWPGGGLSNPHCLKDYDVYF